MIKKIGNLITATVACGFYGIACGSVIGLLFGALLYLGSLVGHGVHFFLIVPLYAMGLGALGGLMAGLIGGGFAGLPGFWIGGLMGGALSSALLPPHGPPIGLLCFSAVIGAVFGLWVDWQMKSPASRYPLIQQCQAVFRVCSVSECPFWSRCALGALISFAGLFVVLSVLNWYTPPVRHAFHIPNRILTSV